MRNIETDRPSQNSSTQYLDIIRFLETYCQGAGLDHRFVGGTLTDFIGPQTDYQIDPEQRKVKLIDPQKPSMIRSDNTVKDIDLVVFTPDKGRYEAAKHYFEEFQAWVTKTGTPFPFISIEAARHPGWPRRNVLKQFVSAFEYDPEGRPYLAFGVTIQAINPDSLKPWNTIGTKVAHGGGIFAKLSTRSNKLTG